MSGARVLIIEDEAMLRSSMVRGLSRLPGLEVVQAGTLGEGLALIDQATPALILSDIDLPDRSGLELIGEVGRRGLRTPIVFISAYLKAFRSQIPPHAYVEVLEKPVGIEELRDVVQRHVAVPAQSTGAGAPFGLADYMQLSSLGRHSVTIEVVGKGRVTIFQGQVWSAVDGNGDGTAALQRLLGDTSSQVVCQALKGEPGPRTLTGSAEEVLLEAARLMDEGQASGAHSEFTELEVEDLPLPSPAPPPAVSPSGLQALAHTSLSSPSALVAAAEVEPASGVDAARFETLWEKGLEATFAKRYREALEAFEGARTLRPEDRRVEANIARLHDILKRQAALG